jgi:hypothetical protein
MRLFDCHHISDIHHFSILTDAVKYRITVTNVQTVNLFPFSRIQQFLIAPLAGVGIIFQRFDFPIDNFLAPVGQSFDERQCILINL